MLRPLSYRCVTDEVPCLHNDDQPSAPAAGNAPLGLREVVRADLQAHAPAEDLNVDAEQVLIVFFR